MEVIMDTHHFEFLVHCTSISSREIFQNVIQAQKVFNYPVIPVIYTTSYHTICLKTRIAS
jgi:hypothetical protein